MLTASVDSRQLSAAIQAVAGLGGVFEKSRLSAMKSTGYLVRMALADYIYKDLGPERHWLTARYQPAGRTRWPLRRRKSTHPLAWLGNMARYRAAADGSSVQIDFGKSRTGQPGTFDPELQAIVKRVEAGHITTVTPAMRRMLAAGTRRKRPKDGQPGQDYFALKRTTTQLKTPPRAIMAPAYHKIRPRILPHFEQQFWRKFNQIAGKKT